MTSVVMHRGGQGELVPWAARGFIYYFIYFMAVKIISYLIMIGHQPE